MEALRSLLLDVWREVCRHIEIGEATENIAAMLVGHMPLELVLVRRLDRTRQCLETVAAGPAATAAHLPEVKSECSEDQTSALLAWCRQGTVFCGRRLDAEETSLAPVVPRGVEGEVLAGPLGSPDSPTGALILAAARGQSFVPAHRQMLQLLLEPLSVALENDHRLREMAALREAAEAALPARVVNIEGLVADASGNTLIVNVGKRAGVSVGDRLEVRRKIREVKDPSTGKVIKRVEDKVGEMVVTEVDDGSATGTYTGSGPAKVGDSVRTPQ